jgi:hypothetical protein
MVELFWITLMDWKDLLASRIDQNVALLVQVDPACRYSNVKPRPDPTTSVEKQTFGIVEVNEYEFVDGCEVLKAWHDKLVVWRDHRTFHPVDALNQDKIGHLNEATQSGNLPSLTDSIEESLWRRSSNCMASIKRTRVCFPFAFFFLFTFCGNLKSLGVD